MCATRKSLGSLSSGLPLVVGLSMAAARLASCSSAENPTASNAAAAGEEFGHIHSLDVNPADDTLYVASHHGVFALGADGFERMGEERLDAMSFTIADADRFLMSGHPEPGAGGPRTSDSPSPPTPGGRGGRSRWKARRTSTRSRRPVTARTGSTPKAGVS